MKFFAVLAVVVAVAHANLLLPAVPAALEGEVQQILEAINHPSTDPATAAALEQLLLDVLGVKPEEIAVGPAIVDQYEPISVGPAIIDQYEPISVGPAIVDQYEPISVGPAIVDNVVPSPVIVAPVAPESASAPLVQIILNINQNQAADVAGAPIVIDKPTPVIVAEDVAPIEPTPVIVVEPEVEPVIIGTPILPSPVVVAPEILN